MNFCVREMCSSHLLKWELPGQVFLVVQLSCGDPLVYSQTDTGWSESRRWHENFSTTGVAVEGWLSEPNKLKRFAGCDGNLRELVNFEPWKMSLSELQSLLSPRKSVSIVDVMHPRLVTQSTQWLSCSPCCVMGTIHLSLHFCIIRGMQQLFLHPGGPCDSTDIQGSINTKDSET